MNNGRITGETEHIENSIQDTQVKRLLEQHEKLKKQNQKLRKENRQFRKELEHLTQQANIDFLTGAYNRKGIEFQVDKVLKGPLERAGVLCFLEIENYKQVKDCQGHGYADEVLRETMRILQRSVRSTDLIGRCGEHEFLFYLRGRIRNAYLADRVREITDKITQIQLDEEFEGDPGEPVQLQAVAGFACFPANGKTFTELFDHASLALLKQKKAEQE